MCRQIFVKALTEEGEPYPDAPEPIEFDEDGKAAEELGLCGCWLNFDENSRPGRGGPEELLKAKEYRQRLMEEAIKPFLKKVSWGNIVIEVR